MPTKIILLSLSIVLVACQTTGSSSTTYNIFFTPEDHIVSLIEEDDFQTADDVFAEHRSFFTNDNGVLGDDFKPLVARLTDAIYSPKDLEVTSSLAAMDSWIGQDVTPADWPRLDQDIKNANTALTYFNSFDIFEDVAFAPENVTKLRKRRNEIQSTIADGAAVAFEQYDLLSDTSFFDAYPLGDTFPDLIEENKGVFLDKLKGLDTSGLQTVTTRYDAFLNDNIRAEVGQRYYQTAAAESTQTGFAAKLAAVLQTLEAELPLSELSDVSVSAINVTSRSLRDRGQIEFPITIENDLPFEIVEASLDEALSNTATVGSDIVILIDVAAAKTAREISKMQGIRSSFQSGTRTEPNPAYNLAQNKVNIAQMELQTINISAATSSAQYCEGLGCLGQTIAQIGYIAQQSTAEDNLKSAMETLATTPMNLTIPVYSEYALRRAEMVAAKSASVNFYILDKSANLYVKSSFDAVEKEAFGVLYDLRSDDRNRDQHLSNNDTEGDVLAFEESPLTVSLADLLTQYTSGRANAQPLPDLVQIRTDILEEKNRSVQAFLKKQYEITPDRNDPRFDSVVVMYNPSGSLGTGFFVRDDLILTNYHVIEGSEFVEMKLFGGQETFGKVIAHDIRLDLALVRSQARGKPVEFHRENTIPLGTTVELIGHPDTLEFSISRGVVSSFRELTSLNVPGGKKVQFIQTDAAINPGNSGGPMFMGSTVIGVNTRKLAAVELESLGFAVHHGQVVEFLKNNNVYAGS